MPLSFRRSALFCVKLIIRDIIAPVLYCVRVLKATESASRAIRAIRDYRREIHKYTKLCVNTCEYV
jgi:hypothetical protein